MSSRPRGTYTRDHALIACVLDVCVVVYHYPFILCLLFGFASPFLSSSFKLLFQKLGLDRDAPWALINQP